MDVRKILNVIAITLCLSLLFASCENVDLDFVVGEFSGSAETESLKVKAPEFYVYDNLGAQVKFSDFSVKPSVLFLWTAASSSARGDLQEMNEYYKKYGKEINFMMIHLSDMPADSEETGRRLISDLTVPSYYDMDNSCKYAYKANDYPNYPRLILIDKDGYIIHDEVGSFCVMNSNIQENIPRLITEEPYITRTPRRCKNCIV